MIAGNSLEKKARYDLYYITRFRQDVVDKTRLLEEAKKRLIIAEKEFSEGKRVTGNENGILTGFDWMYR